MRVLTFAILSWTALAAGCAQPQSSCTDSTECDPGYFCRGGECVPERDGGDADDGARADDLGETAGDGDAAPEDAAADGDFVWDPDVPCGTASFEVTETQEEFAVPTNVRYMHVKAWGAGGNAEAECGGGDDGGLGGFSEAVFEVTPGTPLIVIVGKRGRSGITGEDIVRFGFGAWGGGGLSGVFRGPELINEYDKDKALLIAGGGGSAGAPGCDPGGTGNHPDSGGMPTMMGSMGADEVNGGGGGYEGGTGGERGRAGMGGSGYVDPSALDSRMAYGEPGSGTPPRTDDPDYEAPAATGEQSGLVVIHFTCEEPELI